MTREEQAIEAMQRYCLTIDIDDGERYGFDYDEDIKRAFIEAIKWADEHPNNRWISVEDRLPEQNKKVIVICEKLDTAPFYKISLGHIVDKTICKDNYNGWDIPNVVYWTPMPKLPEEI